MLVGANDEALVLAASVEVDTTSFLEERLAEAGYDIDLDALSWGTEYRGAEGQAITIDAPLGMPGIEIGLEDLGLTEQEHQWFNHTGESDVDIWANPVGTDEWVPVELEEVESEEVRWVESVATRPDGTMLMTLHTMSRQISLQSRNGIEWTEIETRAGPQLVHPWAGGLVGIDHSPRPELLISEDGDTWEETGLADRFPPQIEWWAGALAVGDEGIAMSITGYRQSAPTPDREPVEITTDEGHILTLDLEERVLDLDVGGTTHTWEIYRADPPDGMTADVVEQTVTFSDPDTGEELAAVPFNVLVRAEQEFRTLQFGSEEYQVLVFTPDGSEWTIQPARDAFGESTWVRHVGVASGRVFAATLDPDRALYPFDFAEFKLWSAEIP